MISIVIPTHRSHRPKGYEDRVISLVRSCLKQESEDFEILVISNLLDPELESGLASLADSRVSCHFVGKIGVNRARNHGINQARGDLLLFLDDDCFLPEKEFLKKLRVTANHAPEISAFGGGYLDPEDPSIWVRGYHLLTRLWLENGYLSSADARGLIACRDLLGGAVLYRRAIFEKGMRFEESIRSGGDETEFHRRLAQMGYSIAFCGALSVEHRGSERWEDAVTRAWNQGLGSGRYDLAGKSSYRKALKELSCLPFLMMHAAVMLSARAYALAERKRAGLRKSLPRRRKDEWSRKEGSA